jgi:hypothetical protein
MQTAQPAERWTVWVKRTDVEGARYVPAAPAQQRGSGLAHLQQALTGGPMRALVAASRADVAQWLTHVGYKVYVPTLMHLDGAALLLQTQASLTAAGVAPHHVVPLLACIADSRSDDAREPPPHTLRTDEPPDVSAR